VNHIRLVGNGKGYGIEIVKRPATIWKTEGSLLPEDPPGIEPVILQESPEYCLVTEV
jgi:hypothetical protein